MSEFEKELSRILCNGVTVSDEKFYLSSNLVSFFKDWQPSKKLVEVPQIVADWFEENEDDLAYGIWKYIRDWDKQQHNVFYKWFNKDDRAIETLISMQDGYTVKKEQLYVLEFPNRTNPYVYYVKSNMITQQCSQIEDAKRFTEAEIKAIDERYWAFAVKVDEVKP